MQNENEPAWTLRCPINAAMVKVSDICVLDRSRKDFGNLEDLANSIRKNGIIHPPTVALNWRDDDKLYVLLGGERRLRAMVMLGLDVIPVSVRDQVAKHEVLEIELMENFHRKQMLWQEQCVLIAKTHREKQAQATEDCATWGMRETGQLLGVSAAHITHATMLMQYLLAEDAEICAANSMFAAYEILLKRREDEAMKLATVDMNKLAVTASAFGIRTIEDDSDVIAGGDSLDAFLGEHLKIDKLAFDFKSLFRLGDCIELMPTLEAELCNHIVTDPPYGIDLDMMGEMKNIETVADTHKVEQNVGMFEPFLEQSYRLLKPGGYCVLWYDISHHEKLQLLGNKVGFNVQRWPIIWKKLHPCKNEAPRVNFTKDMEFAMVMRKKGAVLSQPQTTSFVEADGQAERKLYDNPFAKPLRVWSFILQAIAYKGQTIFDPYAGQMSCGRAALNMQMIPMGLEIDENHYNRGINGLQQLQKQINGD